MSKAWVASGVSSTISTCDSNPEDGVLDMPAEEAMPPMPVSSARRAARDSGIHKHHPAMGIWVKSQFGPGFVSEISVRQGKEFSEVTFVGGGSVQVCSEEIDGKELLPDQCAAVGQLFAYMFAPSMICAGHKVKHTRHVKCTTPKVHEEEAKTRRRRSMQQLVSDRSFLASRTPISSAQSSQR
mmetsp:Transcript_6985/g.16677  ORF Transcript_6985/g.16677 Transcript_6985/m.16677 type:complete len:183 (+) Transcript_6985:66-614(+)